MKSFGAGMQSTWGDDDASDDKGWGDESIAIMLKHFVGAGAIEGGRNDHQDAGKYDVFPGDNYKAHLVGFMDGGMKLDSKTEQMAAIMPNYGIAYSEDKEYGELMGGGFNKKQISILPQRRLGRHGLHRLGHHHVGTWHREHLDEEQRYRLMIDATVDQYGGGFEPTDVGDPVYEQMVSDMGEDDALARVRDSAPRIFKLMANVELFDQPYSDRTVASGVFGSDAAAAFASAMTGASSCSRTLGASSPPRASAARPRSTFRSSLPRGPRASSAPRRRASPVVRHGRCRPVLRRRDRHWR